ncbi:MAG: N-acetyltransferase family protein [Salaquimonas sp.]
MSLSMPFTIRPAEPKDFASITAIYAEAVAHGTASFELTVADEDEMLKRHKALTDQQYPYIVLEDEDGVQGYAYAGPYRARPAYRWVVENSVYLDEAARGKGYGKALLVALIEKCESLGFRQMIAVIGDSANHASVAVHKSCGFEMIGTLKNMGWKHGRWLDSVYMQLAMGGEGPAEMDSLPGRMLNVTKTP